MKLTYICTNYNNSAFTVAAVASLTKNYGHDISIYVVDNASCPEEVEILYRLAREEPRVNVIASAENLGYFAGLNLGLKAACINNMELGWVVAGNNDLEFPADFCDRLELQRDEYARYSVISPDVVTLDGQHQNPHVISHISTIREIFYDLYYSNYYLGLLIYKLAKIFPRITRRGDEDHWRTARLIAQGHGSCYLLTPKFFSHFNELISPTFMMSEEFFLALQLKSVGEKVFYSPQISVTHHWHGSLQNVPSKRRWLMSRDAHREYRKHVNPFKQKSL
ncbi:MAG: glycosyltransferase family 2 protein [Gammaproteobacteria bacterium]|nr:glycosyltransferase family 2 protein [Gammaproteobacteria bacterium]